MTPRRNRVPESSLVGHYAGPVTRLAACALDIAILNGAFVLGLSALFWLLGFIAGTQLDTDDFGPAFSIPMLALWAFLYFWIPWSLSGSTPGMAIVGIRVVRRDGDPVDRAHAALRVITWPLSFLFFGLGFLGILVGREHRALHDVFAGTAVVYAWDARAARIRFLAQRGPSRAARAPEGAPSRASG
ncbi:MAG TPA: RDD family protein [Acidimicrobiia bacterium]